MRVKKKRILLKCYSPLSIDPTAECGWDDVWLVFKNRRKTIYLGPCVHGLEDLKRDIEINEHIINEEKSVIKPDKELINEVQVDLDKNLDTLKRLTTNESVVWFDYPDNPGCSEIYINVPLIKQSDVEKAIHFYLTKKGYLKAGAVAKFIWQRPRIFCYPM